MSEVPGGGSAQVPAEHAALARRLRAAEDRLYPLAMVDADRYQRALLLVGALARRLADVGVGLDGLAAAEFQVHSWLRDVAAVEGVRLDGLDSDLVVEAAMSQRFRALLTDEADSLRRRTVERARAAGLAWAVLAEPDPAAWRGGSAQWVEVHVTTGTLMVRSVAADAVTGEPTYRLEVLGGAEANAHGIRVQEFQDRAEWQAAIADVRHAFESES
jgi:hypothetical protein